MLHDPYLFPLLLTYLDLPTLLGIRHALLSGRLPLPAIDWWTAILHDTRYLTPLDRVVLPRSITFTLSDVHRLYRHQHQWGPLTLPDTIQRLYHLPADAFSTPSTRGLCIQDGAHLVWHDFWTRQTHTLPCPFLDCMPNELDASWVTHANPPFPWTEHARTSVVAASGTPEDTLCQTNYRQLYRVRYDTRPPASPASPTSPTPTITEHLLGPSFESTVTQLRVLHFRAPFLVVTGFPIAAAPSMPWRHFGVWNIDTRTATLSMCRPPHGFPQPMLPSLSPWCSTLGVRGFWRYETLCADDDTGETVYWTYRGALGQVHLPTGQTVCICRYPAFINTRVTRMAVSRLWGVIGVYDGDDHQWRVYDLATGKQRLYTFDHPYRRTRLVFLPHQQKCVLTRRVGGVIWEREVRIGWQRNTALGTDEMR